MTERIEETNENRAVLVGAGEDRQIEELGRLAATLGLEVAGTLEQGRRDGAGYLGRGKRRELGEVVDELGAGIVVADDELTASQARVLEKDAGAGVVDRTALIIRIFEAHARDAASRLEVELAELEYRLPRLRGAFEALSRLGGGTVLARGPGEQQIEYDRRGIRRRMETIRKRLEEEKAARAVRGARLKTEGPPTVALVGYTNAGKTTILNALSGEHRSTADRLFETLETTTRRVERGSGKDGSVSWPDFVITDTVGFIRKLPTQLVHSFASTLEAARDAGILALCADASSEQLEEEIGAVEETLVRTLGEDALSSKQRILSLNKKDLLSQEQLTRLSVAYPDAVFISAREDASPLLGAIHEAIAARGVRTQLLIPHSEYGEAATLYDNAEIHARTDTEEGLLLDVTLPKTRFQRYARYAVSR